MPRPIFNVVLTFNNDFAAVRSDFCTDHFCGTPSFPVKKQARLGFVPLDGPGRAINKPAVGFNRRKLEDQRREAAEKEAASRRATDGQVLGDAEQLFTASNERQAKRMPMLFSPTIGAAISVTGVSAPNPPQPPVSPLGPSDFLL
jgi:hypothetical protein